MSVWSLGTCFAEFGADVTCVDVDEAKVTRLKAGEIPIYEPGLDNLVQSNVKFGGYHLAPIYRVSRVKRISSLSPWAHPAGAAKASPI